MFGKDKNTKKIEMNSIVLSVNCPGLIFNTLKPMKKLGNKYTSPCIQMSQIVLFSF